MSDKVVMFTRLMHGSLIMAALLSVFTNFCPQNMILPVWICYIITIPVIATYIAIEHIPHMIAYLFYCGALSVLVWTVAPNTYYKYLFVIATVFICCFYFVSRVQDKESWMVQPHYLCLIIFFILYIIGLYLDREEIRQFIYQTAFLYLICYAVYVNQKNFERYIELNGDTANFPFQQMRMVNTVMLVLFVVILSLVMLLFPSSGLDRILLQIGALFLSFLRFLVSMFASDSVSQGSVVPETEAANVAEDRNNAGVSEVQSHSQWLDLISNILTWSIVIVAFLAMIGGALYGTYRLYKAFDRTISENGDKTEYLPSKTEAQWSFFGGEQSLFKKKKLWMNFSLTASIRKLWIKGLRSHERENIASYLTPEELHNATKWESREAHDLYEKARYSRDEVTREDLDQMKRALRDSSHRNASKG